MKRTTVFLVLSIFLFSTDWASCQQKRIIEEVIAEPIITVAQLQPEESPVRVTDVKIDVKVIGSIAVTTVDMIFFNPNHRILEGQLEFPLSEGQSISRFALDINGKLREGVVVDKQKGQQVFEDVIRQQVDPGLLEKTKGNNFRTRVYPLPAQGTRKVVIAYQQELKKEGNDYRFHLPVQYGDLDNFDLQVIVFSAPKMPKVEETPWGKFSFDKANEAFIASYNKKNFKKQGQLVFTVPVQADQTVFVEKGEISGDTYFYANVQPDRTLSLNKASEIKTIDIYWDASSSMIGRDIEKDLEFMEAYIKTLGDVNVNLYRFNIFCDKVASYKIQGNCAKLKETIRNIAYDGATQYGNLNFKNAAKASKADQILLFSDGISTFGQPEAILGNIPFVIVSSQLSADYSLLNYMSSATGGAYINLMQKTMKEAIASVRETGISFLSADYNPNEIADLNPAVPQRINAEDVFAVTGKLKTASARVTLHFGVNNKILSSKTITLKASATHDYDNIVECMWAQKQIASLDLRYEKNKAEIEALGRRFNVVTRNTSLIVLDNVSDYVRYEITPPSELLEEYIRLIAGRKIEKNDKAEKEAIKNKINSVVYMFGARKEWWNKTFPKNCKPQPKPRKDRTMLDARSVETEILSTEDVGDAVSVAYAPVLSIVEDSAPAEESMMIEMEESSTRIQTAQKQDVSEKKLVQEKVVAKDRVRAKIALKQWNPDTPYMAQLKVKSDKELYATYLTIKEEYNDTPSFYLDVASLFEDRKMKKEALIILSNLAEMEIEDYRLLRVLANRLRQLEYNDYAIDFFKKVLELRPFEPQSFRDLGLTYADKGQYQESIDALYEIVKRSWDGRFPEIEVIALEEMNRVIAHAKRNGKTPDLSDIDKRLIYEMPVNIRIVLNWDTDNSDMDLWVTDPCGEVCIYSNPRTYIGGLLSRDFTGGYGPEEFMIKEAMPGKYRIQANYYGSSQQTLIGATTIYLDVYTYYSSGKEKKETITLRLTENKETIDIGEIVFERR